MKTTEQRIHHRTATVDGHEIFYREAGPADAPVLLLLHGFPTSSYMFRDLIPRLADRYRVIAPDHIGFGHSATPSAKEFPYTFAELAQLTADFTTHLNLTRFALYIQDYGAPIGLRLALAHPERITAIITQNGNAYTEGLGQDAWAPVRALIANRTPETEEAVSQISTLEGIKWQYTNGVPPQYATLLDPDAWHHDAAQMSREGQREIQLDLIADYGSNFELYPAFQEYFRTSQIPLLATWGRHDEVFIPAGAEAFRKDLPQAEIHLLPSGHFALETHAPEIAELIRDFLARHVPKAA
ncbi:alpha/beta fold hydrolase [Streptomyces sp. NPDC050738]|uniref:alpha/beta fold hydrolase n=1 Tax=Streptomyces sp. NPDC050738 TaxID=3154744 RepID=UPI00343CB357